MNNSNIIPNPQSRSRLPTSKHHKTYSRPRNTHRNEPWDTFFHGVKRISSSTGPPSPNLRSTRSTATDLVALPKFKGLTWRHRCTLNSSFSVVNFRHVETRIRWLDDWFRGANGAWSSIKYILWLTRCERMDWNDGDIRHGCSMIYWLRGKRSNADDRGVIRLG